MLMCVCVCVTAEDMQGKTEEEIEMMKLMGFGSFDTTKVSVTPFFKAPLFKSCTWFRNLTE